MRCYFVDCSGMSDRNRTELEPPPRKRTPPAVAVADGVQKPKRFPKRVTPKDKFDQLRQQDGTTTAAHRRRWGVAP
jgi:hypothetical protein